MRDFYIHNLVQVNYVVHVRFRIVVCIACLKIDMLRPHDIFLAWELDINTDNIYI